MPNTFAYIALIIWPIISIILYKKLSVVEATFWTIIGGFLVLPVRTVIDFPVIPALDKETIPAIMAFIGCVYIKKIKIKLIPGNGLVKLLIITFVLTPVFTTLNNQEPVNLIPGLKMYDAFSYIIKNYLLLLPFIIGMQIIKSKEDQLILFKLLSISALAYSLLVLFEIRMSPQLHSWIYGYFPHSWAQQARFSGFRAVVFVGHGLLVSMYIAIALGALSIMLKNKYKLFGVTPWVFIIYLVVVLILNKTVSGFLLGALLFLFITLLSENTIKRFSIMLIAAVILYPALTIFDLFPHEQLIQLALDFDQKRGESLAFRFHNEGLLLEHAQEKILFGWGGWKRNFVEGAIIDGLWIGVLGTYGLTGFISLFGLTFISVWKAAKIKNIKSKNEKHLLYSHILIASVIMVDQLPNSSFDGWAVFFIGGLLGRAIAIRSKKPVTNTGGRSEIQLSGTQQ